VVLELGGGLEETGLPTAYSCKGLAHVQLLTDFWEACSISFIGSAATTTRQHDREQDMTCTSTRSAWRAVPTSGFKVNGPDGSVPLIQIDHSRFIVTAAFELITKQPSMTWSAAWSPTA
jgi:hypothetical protein